jgi:hypothetical protein
MWIGKVGITPEITFMSVCTMMEDVALEATVNPDNCLLAKFYELGAARWNSSSRMWLFH